MGFSPWGLIVGVAVFAPSLLLLAFPPRDRLPTIRPALALTVLERAGQALCLVVPAITEPGGLLWWWALPAALTLLAYDALWARYLVRGRRAELLFESVIGVPVPMAILPVAVFACAAAWLVNPWLAGSAIILAAGHIPVSLAGRNALRTRRGAAGR
ncbi:hypothetical protein LLS1_23750 [Leifsonia sp. LS1]|uniref:hypothetical protein n=1 Tax=Leifsonia sp. LS1 TaxID=2828483 RepID=UPI001CFD801F|nr:hypothetical protein [Leifsonia sp. LS1]GIT80706.1 hypothetical protein LLS1_23750 [Leifsonia sp. LS1]